MSSPNKYIFLSILAYFTCLSFVFSQENKQYSRELTYAQLWEEILNCQDSIYELKNALIKMGSYKSIQKYHEILKVNNRHVIIKPQIILDHLTFEQADINGEKWGDTNPHTIGAIELKNMTFEERLTIKWCENFKFFTIDSTKFQKGLTVSGNDLLTFRVTNSTINTSFCLSNDNKSNEPYVDDFSFFNSTFYLKKSQNTVVTYNQPKRGAQYMSMVPKEEIEPQIFKIHLASKFKRVILSIDKCSFQSDTAINYMQISGGIEHLFIDSSDFNLNFEFSEMNKLDRLFITNSTIDNIAFYSVSLPETNNINFRWSQVKNNLVLLDDASLWIYENSSLFLKKKFDGLLPSDHENALSFDKLMANYNHLFHIYKERGDLESANKCYIEMKEVQVSRFEYLYTQDTNTHNWLYWKLNVFLGDFCDYGTNPVKAIIWGLWIILYFSFFYFFFHSRWDGINQSFLLRQYDKLAQYFTTKQNLEDFYTEKHITEYITYDNFKQKLSANEIKVPHYFMLLGKPLYNISLFKIKIMTWFYQRFEILKGRWVDLNSKERKVTGVKVFIALVIYISYLLLIRMINSLILSINVFSTLGFGDIPVTGASRYLAIIEGFIGWFLLSIFSVTLISQILQN